MNRMHITDKEGVYRFYTTEKVSPRKSITPEGFLLCEGVPIARTGTQFYAAEEVPIESQGGIVTINRTDEEVFNPTTLASFEGKSVTIDHPQEFVNPSNWRALTTGITQNVRRGIGVESDLLLADLLLTAQEAIDEVNKGTIEISCGYDTNYVQDAPGVGRQTNIIGNHVAIVKRGRAGSRCSIRDKDTVMGKRTVWDKIMTAFKAKDEDALKEAVEEAKDEDNRNANEEGEDNPRHAKDTFSKILDRLTALDAKMKDMEEKIAKKEEDADKDDDDKDLPNEATDLLITPESAGKLDNGKTYNTGKASDSVELLSKTEVLVPGLSLTGKETFKTILTKALDSDHSKETVSKLLRGRTVDSLSQEVAQDLFHSAAEMVAQQNNSKGIRHSVTVKDFGRVSPIDLINQRNAEYWAKQGAK